MAGDRRAESTRCGRPTNGGWHSGRDNMARSENPAVERRRDRSRLAPLGVSYRGGNRMMAVSVTTALTLRALAPQVLREGNYLPGLGSSCGMLGVPSSKHDVTSTKIVVVVHCDRGTEANRRRPCDRLNGSGWGGGGSPSLRPSCRLAHDAQEEAAFWKRQNPARLQCGHGGLRRHGRHDRRTPGTRRPAAVPGEVIVGSPQFPPKAKVVV